MSNSNESQTRSYTREQDILQRLKKLEEHDSHLTVKELLNISGEHNKRIEDFEEWKQVIEDWKKHVYVSHSFSETVEIDKKVWEDIKYAVRTIDIDTTNYRFRDFNFKALKDAIKKADPT